LFKSSNEFKTFNNLKGQITREFKKSKNKYSIAFILAQKKNNQMKIIITGANDKNSSIV
jgi:hypothetical protein